ncbi:hypothetical protein D1872_186150 [compost metagenome]
MRQTIKEIEVNNAYRWFLGLTLDDKVPHFTTYGKNVVRRFQDKKEKCAPSSILAPMEEYTLLIDLLRKFRDFELFDDILHNVGNRNITHFIFHALLNSIQFRIHCLMDIASYRTFWTRILMEMK